MSTNKIGFYEDLTKNIFELSYQISANMHFISSAAQIHSYSAPLKNYRLLKFDILENIFEIC